MSILDPNSPQVDLPYRYNYNQDSRDQSFHSKNYSFSESSPMNSSDLMLGTHSSFKPQDRSLIASSPSRSSVRFDDKNSMRSDLSPSVSHHRHSSPLRRSPLKSILRSSTRSSPLKIPEPGELSQIPSSPRFSTGLRKSSPARYEVPGPRESPTRRFIGPIATERSSSRHSSPLRRSLSRSRAEAEERLSTLSPIRGRLDASSYATEKYFSPVRHIEISTNRNSSPLRRITRSINRSERDLQNGRSLTPNKSSPLRTSYLQRSSFRAERYPDISSPFVKPSESENYNRSRLEPRRPVYSSSISNRNDLLSILTEQMNLYKSIEALKVDLALKPDFNLYDAFKIFDVKDKGWIVSGEIEDGLIDLGIKPVRDEVYLLVRHYSPDFKFRFSHFCEIILPQNPDYARLLKQRSGLGLPLSYKRRPFNPSTMDILADLLKGLLDCEGIAESLRQKVSKTISFSLHEAFQAIDMTRDGVITPDDFDSFFHAYHIVPDRREIEELMSRYDRNRDGVVSYSEFISELTPKSSLSYY